jgi:hypothetical protein
MQPEHFEVPLQEIKYWGIEAIKKPKIFGAQNVLPYAPFVQACAIIS